MAKFIGVRSLKDAMEITKNSFSEIGIRLILTEDFLGLRKLHEEAKKLGLKVRFLTEFLQEGCLWIEYSLILEKLRAFLEEDSISVLFSVDNQLRFFDREEFNSFFLNLFRTKTKRSYLFVALSGLKERIGQILEKRADFSDFIFEYQQSANSKAKLFVLNPELKVDKNTVVDYREFLNLWMREEDYFIVKFRSLYKNCENAKPDTALEVIRIDSYRDYALKFFDIREDFEEKEEFWKFILDSLNAEGVYSIWDLSYIRNIGRDKTLWLETFISKSGNERRLLLYYANKHVGMNIPYDIWDEVELFKFLYTSGEDLDFERVIEKHPYLQRRVCEKLEGKYYSFVLDCEKANLLRSYSEHRIDLEELKRCIDLKAYLDESVVPVNLNPEQEWILEYFKEYRKSKLQDRITESLEEILEKYNSTSGNFYSWYETFNNVKVLYKEMKDSVDRVLWIDGLGFEWAGFVVNLLKDMGIEDIRVYIARVELPSITEMNHLEAERIGDFDKLLHEKYNYPDSIVEQMGVLKRVIKERVNPRERLLIISDHGSSALVRLKKAIPCECKAEHGGRYIRGGFNIKGAFIHDNTYTIALTHTPLDVKPKGEAHGGATPEEVLVPIFLVNSGKKRVYNLILKEKSVKRRLYFKLVPPKYPKGVYIDTERVNFIQRGEYFEVNLTGFKIGKHTLKVMVEDDRLEEDFVMEGGFHEEAFGLF